MYSVPALCVALFVFGAATGMVNVAANAVGVQVEASVGRPILSGLHAGFSLGGLGGALVGGAASSRARRRARTWRWSRPPASSSARGRCPRCSGAGRGTAARRRRRAAGGAARRPTAVLVVLGAIAGCTAFGEGALTDWGALLLREDLGAPATVAAAGYAGFSLAMAGGRLAGGRLLQAMGERRLLVGGAVLAAAGAARGGDDVVPRGRARRIRASSAWAWPTSSRWRSAAPACSGVRAGIALATTVGYTGLLGGPPVIGLLAESAGLPVARRLGRGHGRSSPPSSCSPSPASGCACRGRAPCSTGRWRVGGRLQPVVSGFGHGTGVYVRDLQVLIPDA